MSKPAKLAILLCAAWLVIDILLLATGSFHRFSGSDGDNFAVFLLAGWTLINLSVFGYQWYAKDH